MLPRSKRARAVGGKVVEARLQNAAHMPCTAIAKGGRLMGKGNNAKRKEVKKPKKDKGAKK
jgi:hypothetical protein